MLLSMLPGMFPACLTNVEFNYNIHKAFKDIPSREVEESTGTKLMKLILHHCNISLTKCPDSEQIYKNTL